MTDHTKDSAEAKAVFYEAFKARLTEFRTNTNQQYFNIDDLLDTLIASVRPVMECPHFIPLALQATCTHCKNK
jgi:hypothetical protein